MTDATAYSTVRLADGRTLDVLVSDGSGDVGLVAHHGTPGEASRYAKWAGPAAGHGLRFVTFSRPGYAGSTRLHGRNVASVAADVAELLDQLGIERFVTVGGSGGGPHAVALAALLPERCLAAAALVTIAPWGAAGLDWWAGMTPSNVEEFGAALKGEAVLRAWMAENGEPYRTITADAVAGTFGEALPPIDHATATGAYAADLAFGFRRALANGFDGWIDDDLAFTTPWGFDPATIRRPVTVWQGELDRLVPWSHGRWLADEIPGARFELALGHGHFSMGVANRDEILADLIDRAGI